MSKHITPVILAVIKKGDKYLLSKRIEEDDQKEFHDLWQLPGGGLEFGESTEDCILRECREELNAKVKIEYMLPKIFHRVYKNKWHGLLITYVCSLESLEADIKLNEEASEWKWFAYEEISNLKTFPLIKPILELVKEKS